MATGIKGVEKIFDSAEEAIVGANGMLEDRRGNLGGWSMETKSLCPVCLKLIRAKIYEEQGQILMKKWCDKHGEFDDIYWSDAKTYHRFAKSRYDGKPEIAGTKIGKGCPFDCGLCPEHMTTTILGIIDITNQCNKNCPICFASANESGYIYEPTIEQIENMMKLLQSQIPPCYAIEFSGGEPTVRKDFLEIIAVAEKLGFEQIQVASNGKKFAENIDFCIKAREAGLRSIYLQFDGFDADALKRIRGYDDLSEKLQCIENCIKAGIKITLASTIVNGENDSEIGEIIKFALETDEIKSVVFQPISHIGRIKGVFERVTVPDILASIEKQTKGQIRKSDFYPLNLQVPIAKFLAKLKGRVQPEFSVHHHCGAGTHVFLSNGDIVPVTRFLNLEKMIEALNRTKFSRMGCISAIEKIKLALRLNKSFDRKKMPSFLIRPLVKNFLTKKANASALRGMRSIKGVQNLTITAMHFQDRYNFDVERVKRCGLHYATPDGRIIPFCVYNTMRRESVEKEFSTPTKTK